jgi:hypothetical protein
MTEAEWLACTDPQKMLAFLRRTRRLRRPSDRQLRLFAAACVRHVARQDPGVGDSIGEVVLAERFADGMVQGVRLNQGRGRFLWTAVLRDSAWLAAKQAARLCGAAIHRQTKVENAEVVERAAQAGLLRCILGNPFRPVRMNPAWLAWNDGCLLKLAEVAYDCRDLPSGFLDPTRRSLLADALEDAGCASAALLDHLRDPDPHVRGCWVVDLLLGKS